MKRVLLYPVAALLMLASEPAVGVDLVPRDPSGFKEAACDAATTGTDPWHEAWVEELAYDLAPLGAAPRGGTR